MHCELFNYFVRPHPKGGVTLTGPLIPFPLRYDNECSAASYAHHVARMTGARVIVFNRRGDIDFCERSKPIACARP
jgi:hypothetical protein